MSAAPLLEARQICKSFGALRANDNVSLRIAPGSAHALIGENGAGKSTLVSVLYGLTQADSGELLWRGKPAQIRHPAQARRLGIGIVFQKFSLFEPLTVFENIALGAPNITSARLQKEMARIGERYGLAIDPQRRVADLAMGEKQRVEIVRCLLQNPSLLIMDEPTSALTPAETPGLFALLKTLIGEGCAVLFISHKLDEVEELCEEMTILRRGKTVAAGLPVAKAGRAETVRLMVGEDIAAGDKTPPPANAKTTLLLQNARIKEDGGRGLRVQRLELKAGVVVGVAGIAGNGQELLQQALSGEAALPPNALQLGGKAAGAWGPQKRAEEGLLTVPTDRHHTASVGGLSLADNILLGAPRRQYTRRGWLLRKRMESYAAQVIKEFEVATPGADALAGSLSGGNLQKFVVGRAILQRPRALAVANPTWGVDVRAAHFIRQALLALRAQGAAILVISEDLDELFAVADEIAVINGGVLGEARALTPQTSVADIGAQMTQATGAH